MSYSCHWCGESKVAVRNTDPLEDVMTCRACLSHDWIEEVDVLRTEVARLTARLAKLKAVREAATALADATDGMYDNGGVGINTSTEWIELDQALAACAAPEPRACETAGGLSLIQAQSESMGRKPPAPKEEP